MARFKDGKFTRYDVKAGLFNNGVFQMLEDDRDNFWISSNHGIFRVSRKELDEYADHTRSTITSVAYGKGDGMLNIECNGGRWPAGIRTRDGKLWFPTQQGVAVVDPEAVPFNRQPPPVIIESVLLDRSPVTPEGEIKIQPRQENFEIDYTALSYIGSEDLKFKYKLEGLDRDWVDAGTRRTAYFSHLPPGKYTFKVIAANRDGVWNFQGASLQLSVLPRFYQTWWFSTLVAAAAIGGGFSLYRRRVNRLEQARKTQEDFSRRLLQSQEQERQRIAAELHDSLGQSLLIIKNRVALAQKEIEERDSVEEQLGELSHSASSAIEECREIAYNLRPFQLDRFGLSRTLGGIFTRIGEVTPIQVSTEIDAIDDLLDTEAQVNVYRIVQECANNIIKHSQATEASLFVKRRDSEIVMVIQDNGRGLAAEKTDAGLALRAGEPIDGSVAKRGGFGLIGIAERVKMLHGTYKIDTVPGVSIRIKIPIGG
jgi:signal transduction histidine kinase